MPHTRGGPTRVQSGGIIVRSHSLRRIANSVLTLSSFAAEFVIFGVKSAALGRLRPNSRLTGAFTVMKVTEPAPIDASCTIRAGM